MLRVDQNIRRIYNLANTLCFDIIRIDLLDVKESQLITRKTVEEKIMNTSLTVFYHFMVQYKAT